MISVSAEEEGRYLIAILNSENARKRVAALQARGQWGARHFDKALWWVRAFDQLPIERPVRYM